MITQKTEELRELMRQVIEEHRRIRGYIESVGVSVNDMDALFSVRKNMNDWSQSSLNTLIERQSATKQTLILLEGGLNRHFALEGRTFPQLFGDLVARAFFIEHADIMKKVAEASAALETRLDGMQQKELLETKSRIQNSISAASVDIEEHARREEIVIRMVDRALDVK